MTKIHQTRTMVLCLIASAVVGCQTSERQTLSSSKVTSDIVHYTGAPPVWMFVPIPNITDLASGYPAEIALSPYRRYTTNFVEIVVAGEVVCPGRVRLPAGSTVLQAIGCAGGFTEFASNKRFHITKASGRMVTLYLHSRRTADRAYRQVWCDTAKDEQGISPNQSPRSSSKDLVSDYILDDGDGVHVPRTVM